MGALEKYIQVTRSETDGSDLPTKVVFERAESSAYPTDSKGCVICPSTTPAGPTCGANQERLLRTQTCSQCPEYYCDSIDDDGSGSGPSIGGIVGGVVGGVAVVVAAGLLYYFLIWKKKHPTLDEEEDLTLSELEMDHENKDSFSNDSQYDGDRRQSSGILGAGAAAGVGASGQGGSGTNSATSLERPGARRLNSNRRLSSYESFTRPQAKFKGRRGGARAGQRQLKSRNLINSSQNYANRMNSPYLDPNSSNRNSIATTISTTNASNILPIAYIPGVTVRPTKNNTKSIYSYETDSIFSDLNTIENASIIGDIMRANYNAPDNDANEPNDNTMTAIKAQPRLVNVDRIEEEEEDDEDDDDEYHDYDHISGHASADAEDDRVSDLDSKITKSSVHTATRHVNDSTLSNINITDSIVEEDSDSDVDSDIGEIQRATSIRRNQAQVKQVQERPAKEIPLDLIDLGKPTKGDEHSLNDGSFVLDVEIDNPRPQSHSSGERSPFEDP